MNYVIKFATYTASDKFPRKIRKIDPFIHFSKETEDGFRFKKFCYFKINCKKVKYSY